MTQQSNNQGARNHPYRRQPDKAFWQKTVENRHPLDIANWYKPRFQITTQPIATAGSCFAQHIGRELRDMGFNFLDAEPAPGFLPRKRWSEFGYGMYSARYGNVYTSRQLLQLLQRALGEFLPKEPAWKKDGGVVDPFRPTIEAQPFANVDEMAASREHHLRCVAKMFEATEVFVFTLGLTEGWMSRADGSMFPVCPGAAGGEFSPEAYRFVNLAYPDVRGDMEDFIARVRQINPRMQIVLTVSPVPLMATATTQQVVVANSYSKSVLRAVAGYLQLKFPFVDYFPSYEMISSHVMHGQLYNPDMRTVATHGVKHVMGQFFKEHPPVEKAGAPAGEAVAPDPERVVCDEELLAAFGRRT